MRKFVTCLVVLTVVALAVPCMARDPLTTTGVFGEGQAAGRVGIRGGVHSEFGGELAWQDGFNGDQEAVGLSVYSTWDLVQNHPLDITLPLGAGTVQLSVTIYSGIKGGAIRNVHGDPVYKATASGVVGILIGDEKASYGVEYQPRITNDMIKSFADVPNSGVFGVAKYQWK